MLDFEKPLASIAQQTILCVGDLMLDDFVYGEVERISPEAPVPVLHIEREERTLGGAGNVLRNLHSLGVATCFVSVTGTDPAGREVARMVAGLGNAEAHVLAERGRITTLKTRYVAGTQQLLRADQENVSPLPEELRTDLVKIVADALPHYKVTVLSDYAKGVLSGGTATEIVAVAKALGSIVVVDPKGHDYSIYRGADVLKPNRPELAAATKMPVGTDEEVVRAARSLIAAHGFGALLVSCGKDGMLVVEPEGEPLKLAAEAREVFDVSGAGDTVVSVMAAALGAGASLGDAARLANAAAGIVVGKVGTAVVHGSELTAAILAGDDPRLKAVGIVAGRGSGEPLEWIRKSHADLFFQAGTHDERVPHGQLEALIEAAPGHPRVRWYDTRHGMNRRTFDDQVKWQAVELGVG